MRRRAFQAPADPAAPHNAGTTTAMHHERRLTSAVAGRTHRVSDHTTHHPPTFTLEHSSSFPAEPRHPHIQTASKTTYLPTRRPHHPEHENAGAQGRSKAAA